MEHLNEKLRYNRLLKNRNADLTAFLFFLDFKAPKLSGTIERKVAFINTNIRENQVFLMVVMIRLLDLDYTGMNIYQQSLYAQIKVEIIFL